MGGQVLGRDKSPIVLLINEDMMCKYYKKICYEDEYKGEYFCVGNLVLRRKEWK
jgi:hypothetical protein